MTDSWDRRTSNALLIPFCNYDVTKPDYKFSANGVYRSIPGETKEDFVKARPTPDETVPGQTRH